MYTRARGSWYGTGSAETFDVMVYPAPPRMRNGKTCPSPSTQIARSQHLLTLTTHKRKEYVDFGPKPGFS